MQHSLNHYETFVAEGDSLKTCLELRNQVFGEEFQNAPSTDELDSDSVVLGCRDRKTKQVVGCIRLTSAEACTKNKIYQNEYQLQLFPKVILPNVTLLSKLAISKEYRKTQAGLSLYLKAYSIGPKVFESRFFVLVCEPNLYPLYRHLGFQPLAPVFRSGVGAYYLPLYLKLHDLDLLSRLHSPFLDIAKEENFPRLQTDWIAPGIDSGFAIMNESDAIGFESWITQGVSEKGKQLLFTDAIPISFQRGEVVLAKGDRTQSLGFVKTGFLEVKNARKVITVLGEGDIFGELAFMLNIPRTADVLAASPQCEVILLNPQAINKLTEATDREMIWKNLAKLVAKRLAILQP